jgi:prepilin signal peptidase PulO-like enzyme (type II secretory pathway)
MIPFLVYEEQRLTSKQLIESIRNVLSPSNGNPILRASSVPDLDMSYIPLLFTLVGFVGIIVVIFLELHVSLVADFTLLTPIVLAILLVGSLWLYASNYSTLDRNGKIMGAMAVAVIALLFASSVYQTIILKREKDVSGNILP